MAKDLSKLSTEELDAAAYEADEGIQKARKVALAVQAERDRRWAEGVLARHDVAGALAVLRPAGIDSTEAVGIPGN